MKQAKSLVFAYHNKVKIYIVKMAQNPMARLYRLNSQRSQQRWQAALHLADSGKCLFECGFAQGGWQIFQPAWQAVAKFAAA